ncbi:MAG: ATP-binding protein [Spongiibacteraceae bacterium]|nr:ATP-binding protein [Spongiibacteraceae bacterium]
MLAAAIALPRYRHLWRAALLLGVLAGFAFMQLAVAQLGGSGRLSLLSLSLLALVLIGPCAGWLVAGLGMALYAAVALMLHIGWLAAAAWPSSDASSAYWALQGVRLFSSMVTLLTLLTLFNALQRRTLLNERRALLDLQAATAARQRLEREVTMASEAERRRLGAELHDGLCQQLTAALLDCTALACQAAPAAPPAALARLREILEASLDSAHDVARGLCPLSYDQTNIVPALARLCQNTRQRAGIDGHLDADAGIVINNPEAALHLYRIAGEAVANAVKHARCRRITVRLAREGDAIVLNVRDDGRGMAAESGGTVRLGCSIMAYRAALLGGALEITSKPDHGTSVTCRVPHDRGTS